MGKKSRLKRELRKERLKNQHLLKREALSILRSVHKTIQGHCHENSRNCWQYMLEMMAHSTGWTTDTSESKHLWEKMCTETRWTEFYQCWMDEVIHAERNRISFSEPIGELLEELEGTNQNFGQYFTPMPVVRLMNEIAMPEGSCMPNPDGSPSKRGADPCCGTGRFMIDALVFNPGLFMHAIDLDLWMMRTAMLNVRMLAKWTSLRFSSDEMLEPFDEGADPVQSGGIIIGGRSVFMHGDSLVVDTEYRPNWLCAGWSWDPKPWRSNIKIKGFFGNFDEWNEAGCPALEDPGKAGDIQFDYSMRNEPPRKIRSANDRPSKKILNPARRSSPQRIE